MKCPPPSPPKKKHKKKTLCFGVNSPEYKYEFLRPLSLLLVLFVAKSIEWQLAVTKYAPNQ